MEFLLIGTFVSGIGIGIVGVGFLICEKSIWEYFGESWAKMFKGFNRGIK